METRTIEEENKAACEQRKRNKEKLTHSGPPPEEKKALSLEVKLSLGDSSPTKDDNLDYDAIRISKHRAETEFKNQIHVSQQEQEQQQQQQQQQIQIPSQQLARGRFRIHYDPYPGYKNLVSIQDYEGHVDQDAMYFLTTTWMKMQGTTPTTDTLYKARDQMMAVLKQLRGNHSSQYGGIGYLTREAAQTILQRPKLFGSGLMLDNLPDGFTLYITQGERHLPPPYLETQDYREYPRLVLDYQQGIINPKKNPLTLRFHPAASPMITEGNAEQFNIKEDKDLFSSLAREKKISKLELWELDADKAKQKIIEILSKKDKQRTDQIVKKSNCYLNYAARFHGFYYITQKVFGAEVKKDSDWTFEQVEKNINDIKQECAEQAKEKRELLFKLMRGEDKPLAEEVIVEYKELLELFNNQDISGLWEVFYFAGCVGLKLFLEKLQSLYNIDNSDTFYYFKNTFLRYSSNWQEFLDDDVFAIFDKIIEMSPRERAWWDELTLRHFRICEEGELKDLFGAYEYFLNEYRKTGKAKVPAGQRIDLPAEYPLERVCNLKVVLDRLLVVMNSARNFLDQAENLQGLNFNSNDLYYAAVHQGHSLLAADMDVEKHKTTSYAYIVRNNVKKIADVDLILTFEELTKLADNKHFPLSTAAVKYLGPQRYSAPYRSYIQAFNDITKVDGMGYLLSDNLTRNWLIFIITVTTTHERGHRCDILQELKQLTPTITEKSHATKEVFHQILGLLNDAKWLNLTETLVVARLYHEVNHEQLQFLHDSIVDYKEEFLKHLILRDQNKHALAVKDYLSCLQLLREVKEDSQLKIKLPRIFSIMRGNEFKITDVKELLTQLRNFEKENGKYAYDQLIDILSILQVENDSPPTLSDFIGSAKAFIKVQGTSLPQHITRCLPKHCTYDPSECRAYIIPPLGMAKILKSLQVEARKKGIPLDEKKLESSDALSYIVMECSKNKRESGRKIAQDYVTLLQNEQLKEHEYKIALDDKNKKRLHAIIHTIFRPEIPEDKIAESILPMNHYSREVGRLVAILEKIKTKWPLDIEALLIKIQGNPSQSAVKRSITYLNDFLEQVANSFSRKLPFPNDFFSLLVQHEEKHGIDPKLLALTSILGAKQLTREHKMLLLRVNLHSAVHKVNATSFINELLQNYNQFSQVFSRLLLIIVEQVEKPEVVFESTLFFMKLLSDINNEHFTRKIFTLLMKNPKSYLPIINRLQEIHQDEPKPIETKAIETKSEEKKPSGPKKRNRLEMVCQIILQSCDAKTFKERDIVKLLTLLSYETQEVIQALFDLKPPPTFDTLYVVLQSGCCKQFLVDVCVPRFDYRNLNQQFHKGRIVSAIEEMKDLFRQKPMPYSRRRELLQQSLLVNNFGFHPDYPIYCRKEHNRLTYLTAKDLTEPEIKTLVQTCRKVCRDENESPANKENARLIFVTLMREAMWRVTRKFPYSTQILSILDAISHPGNLLLGIETGEGKGMMMAMLAATLWLDNDAVNVCTSNLELARVAFEEFSPVFDMLGIPRNPKLLTSQSAVAEYCYDGINYSDTAQLSLFVAKQRLDPFYIKNYQHLSYGLAMDEADFTLFDDATHYRFAKNLHKVDLTWVFEPLYQFIKTDEFKKKEATIGDDIAKARELLLSKAKQLNKDTNYIAKLSDKQIDTWLESALAASRLKIEKDFVIREEIRSYGDSTYPVSFARILSNSRISEGAEWSNGVHQFLHARLNEERETKQLMIPRFPIDPETAPIASMSSKNVIEHHLKRGRFRGVTATPGSVEELHELRDKHAIDAHRIPPHRPNKRQSDLPVLANGQEDHFAKIMDSILRHLRQNESWLWSEPDKSPQPILVAFNDIEMSQKFYEHLQSELATDRFARYKSILHSQLLNGSVTKVDNNEEKIKEEEVVSQAGVAGWITVSTQLGRGTDIKPRLTEEDREQNHPNGLYVIQTFVTSQRSSRQIDGRAARLGHVGQTQLIVDQKEFAKLPIPAEQKQNLEAMAILQIERAEVEKSKRKFAESLGSVKNYFFGKYIELVQEEKHATSDLHQEWARCLNNIDVEWLRIVSKYRQYSLSETEILAKSVKDLVERACADWNTFAPNAFLLQPEEVEEEVVTNGVSESEEKEVEDEVALPLKINDVSPAKTYIDHNPLLVTAPDEAKALIAAKRDKALYECLSQIVNSKIDTDRFEESLSAGVMKLIKEGYVGKIPFRKNLIELFAIVKWGENEKLQARLLQIVTKCFFDFAMSKLGEYKKEIPVITINKGTGDLISKQLKQLSTLLISLKKIKRDKAKEKKSETMFDSVMAPVVSLIYGDCYKMLESLLEIIDQPFLHSSQKLAAAVNEAKTRPEFAKSWCVTFAPLAEAKTEVFEEDQEEDEFVLV